MAKLVAENDLEKEFTAACVKHSAKLNEMWEALKELSDESGIPVGPYAPTSFKQKFGYDGEVDIALVRQLTGTTAEDSEFWYSSSANC